MEFNRKGKPHRVGDYLRACPELYLRIHLQDVEMQERSQFIVDSVIDHMSGKTSKECERQCERQLDRLDPKTRWPRKSMKGYHLREVVVG